MGHPNRYPILTIIQFPYGDSSPTDYVGGGSLAMVAIDARDGKVKTEAELACQRINRREQRMSNKNQHIYRGKKNRMEEDLLENKGIAFVLATF